MSALSRRKMLDAVGSSMGARVGTAGLNYGLFWCLSHRLGSEALGGFSLLMNVFLMLQTLPLLGLGIPLWRRSATEPHHLRRELSNALAFALPVAALLGVSVGAIGLWSYGAPMHVPFLLIGASLLPTACTLVAESSLLGRDRVGDVARVNLLESLVRSLLTLAVVWLGGGLASVFSVFLVLRVAAAATYLSHRSIPRPRTRLLSMRMQRRNLAEVPVFLAIALVAAMASRLDLIVLAQLRGLQDAAIYSAASRLYDATLMIPTVTALVMLPTLARQFESAREQFRSTLEIALRVSLVLGLGVALAVAALAQPIIDLLYRPEMSGAAPVLRWLIFASALMLVDTILSSTMLAAKAQARDLHSLVVAFVVMVGSLLTLPVWFGPAGAASAVVLAMTVRVLWRLRWASQALEVRPWSGIVRLAGSAIAGVGGMLMGLQASPLGALVGGLAAYSAAVLLTGVFGRRPWRSLRVDLARLSGRHLPAEG